MAQTIRSLLRETGADRLGLVIPLTLLAIRRGPPAAWAHRWELWLLIGLAFVAWVPGFILAGMALDLWQSSLLEFLTIDVPTWFALGSAIVTLILLVPFYWRVKGRDRPLLALLWKYALAVEVLWIVVLLSVGPNWSPESSGLLLLLLLTELLIALGLLVAFGRAASRQGFRIAVLFILATQLLEHLSFTYEDWPSVDSAFTRLCLRILMLWSTWLYGAVLTLAVVWAVRWADSTGVVGWNAVVIPLAALLLFWATEAVVLSALDVWQLRLDSFGDSVQIVSMYWIEFGVVLAGLLISVGLVYLVRVRNPDVLRPTPTSQGAAT